MTLILINKLENNLLNKYSLRFMWFLIEKPSMSKCIDSDKFLQ
jgi:hypothetical protein